MDKVFGEVIRLVGTSLNGGKYDYNADTDYRKIFLIAKAHGVVNLVYDAIFRSETVPKNIKNNFQKEMYKSSAVAATQEYYEEVLRKAFNENMTKFIFLKGASVKIYYPKPEMRQMNDLDILYSDGNIEMKTLMRGLKINLDLESDVDDHYSVPPYLKVEMHKKPTELECINDYYGDIWKRAINVGGTEYAFTLSDLILYSVIHSYRHMIRGGVGIRAVIDLYVLNKHITTEDKNTLLTELNKLKLTDFYIKFSSMAAVWFDNRPYDEFYSILTEYLFNSGAYGSSENKAVNGVASGKKKYLLKRLFPSAKDLSVNYPVLKKHPVLLPFIWFWRLISAVFTKPKKLRAERKRIKSVTEKQTKEVNYIFSELGIK